MIPSFQTIKTLGSNCNSTPIVIIHPKLGQCLSIMDVASYTDIDKSVIHSIIPERFKLINDPNFPDIINIAGWTVLSTVIKNLRLYSLIITIENTDEQASIRSELKEIFELLGHQTEIINKLAKKLL